MSHRASAAIYFAPDGYQASASKLMGRQVAGAGFLRAFVASERSPILTGMLAKPDFSPVFSDAIRNFGYRGEIQCLGPGADERLRDPGVLYLPGPGVSDFAWRRLSVGMNAYSLCGVTHTTASHAAMESITQLALAPLAAWDAVICTSQAVRQSVKILLDEQMDYLNWRIGAQNFICPQLPVIPLGVHSEDYCFTNQARREARVELGVAEDDIVVIFVGRLSFHAKAHPQAMYLALEAVASRLPQRKIHLLQCGWFANSAIENAFRDGAVSLSPSITHHFLDGRQPENLSRTWAAADIFVSLSDNIQETFGLSPLEAMAAGLPVVVSDWDGYRDTVRDGIDGFRIPSLMPSAPSGTDLASRYALGLDTYDMYCGHTCELVAVDVAATANAIGQLIEHPDLRKQMGGAGRARVKALFDWSAVIQVYRELWADLSERRLNLAGMSLPPIEAKPDRMDPFKIFSGYPSHQLDDEHALFLVDASVEIAVLTLEQCRQLGLNSFAHYVYPSRVECRLILEQLAARPGLSVVELLRYFPVERQIAIRRGLVWMVKMNVIRFPG